MSLKYGTPNLCAKLPKWGRHLFYRSLRLCVSVFLSLARALSLSLSLSLALSLSLVRARSLCAKLSKATCYLHLCLCLYYSPSLPPPIAPPSLSFALSLCAKLLEWGVTSRWLCPVSGSASHPLSPPTNASQRCHSLTNSLDPSTRYFSS